jgi:menaquinone-dependent protoporphyrinogen oxidase
MKVLVSVESKHGSTEEIAAAIAAELLAAGLDVDAIEPADVTTLEGYDAVILGSAIYMGKWMPGVVKFIYRHADALKSRDVWLFSSGPSDDPPKPPEDPAGIAILTRIGAREHRVFSGKIERSSLSLSERLIVKAVHAPEGDFRDWEAIRAWAHGIARALRQPVGSKRT